MTNGLRAPPATELPTRRISPRRSASARPGIQSKRREQRGASPPSIRQLPRAAVRQRTAARAADGARVGDHGGPRGRRGRRAASSCCQASPPRRPAARRPSGSRRTPRPPGSRYALTGGSARPRCGASRPSRLRPSIVDLRQPSGRSGASAASRVDRHSTGAHRQAEAYTTTPGGAHSLPVLPCAPQTTGAELERDRRISSCSRLARRQRTETRASWAAWVC